MTITVNMKKQGKSKKGENPAESKQSAKKAVSSGITQPHNSKKEGLGPNTDRNA